MNKVLHALQFSTNQIIETIVSTRNVDGSYNAAPMGAIFAEKSKVILKPFMETSTYNNICREKSCIINLTTDPEIYLRTAFKIPRKKLPERWFARAVKIKAPILKLADAIIEVQVKKIIRKYKRAEIECKILKKYILKTPPFGYSRARFAVIESIIHATRSIDAIHKKKNREAEELNKLIELYRKLVIRVAPKSNYIELMNELIEKIEAARR